jgi:hypothetical protein
MVSKCGFLATPDVKSLSGVIDWVLHHGGPNAAGNKMVNLLGMGWTE